MGVSRNSPHGILKGDPDTLLRTPRVFQGAAAWRKLHIGVELHFFEWLLWTLVVRVLTLKPFRAYLGGSGGLSKYTHNPYYWPCDDTSYLVRELTYKAPWLFKQSVELPTPVVDITMVLTIHYIGCHPCDDT